MIRKERKTGADIKRNSSRKEGEREADKNDRGSERVGSIERELRGR